MIWTRGQDDWAADVVLLRRYAAVATAVLHVPCIALKPLVPMAGHAAVAAARYMVFTSAHAVDFALRQPDVARAAARVERIYTHGQATASALRARGLNVEEISSVRTAAELGTWLAAVLPAGAAVLVPGPKMPAYDLAGALRQAGLVATAWVCYETEARARAAATDGEMVGAELGDGAVQDYIKAWRGGVCFASPSAVEGFAAVFRPAANRLREALVAYAIGPTTAQAVAPHFADVRQAPRNELEALVAMAVADGPFG